MLRTGFAGSIAVVYANPLRLPFEDAAATAFLGGVAAACEGRFGLLLLQGEGGEDSLRIIQTAAIDGLIVFSVPKTDSLGEVGRDAFIIGRRFSAGY
jgi:hypothetical protein